MKNLFDSIPPAARWAIVGAVVVAAAGLFFALKPAVNNENIDGICYSSLQDTTVMVVASPEKYAGNVVIPETIEHNGKKLYVTAIDKSTFANCDKLSSVTLPAGIVMIGEAAFSGCTSLHSIYISSTTPPAVAADAFPQEVYKAAALYVMVPDSYKAAATWKDFSDIKKYLRISGRNGRLVIENGIGETIKIYDLNQKFLQEVVPTEMITEVELAPGGYIISSPDGRGVIKL